VRLAIKPGLWCNEFHTVLENAGAFAFEDRDIVLEAIKSPKLPGMKRPPNYLVGILARASEAVCSDVRVIKEAVHRDAHLLKYAFGDARQNQKVIQTAKKCWMRGLRGLAARWKLSLDRAPEEIRSDIKILAELGLTRLDAKEVQRIREDMSDVFDIDADMEYEDWLEEDHTIDSSSAVRSTTLRVEWLDVDDRGAFRRHRVKKRAARKQRRVAGNFKPQTAWHCQASNGNIKPQSAWQRQVSNGKQANVITCRQRQAAERLRCLSRARAFGEKVWYIREWDGSTRDEDDDKMMMEQIESKGDDDTPLSPSTSDGCLCGGCELAWLRHGWRCPRTGVVPFHSFSQASEEWYSEDAATSRCATDWQGGGDSQLGRSASAEAYPATFDTFLMLNPKFARRLAYVGHYDVYKDAWENDPGDVVTQLREQGHEFKLQQEERWFVRGDSTGDAYTYSEFQEYFCENAGEEWRRATPCPEMDVYPPTFGKLMMLNPEFARRVTDSGHHDTYKEAWEEDPTEFVAVLRSQGHDIKLRHESTRVGLVKRW